MTKEERQKRDELIVKAANEALSYPSEKYIVSTDDFFAEDPSDDVLVELLIIAVIKNVFYTGKGHKELLYHALDKLLSHRRKKFKSPSIWLTYFHLTEAGRKLGKEQGLLDPEQL